MSIHILTHSGLAHLDEIYGIAALCLAKGFKSEDIEITRSFNQSDAESSSFDYVVDFGLKYDGITRFDHHQDDDAVAGVSSFGLIVNTFDELKTLRGTKFVERIDFQDLNGPVAGFQKFLGHKIAPADFFGGYEAVEQMLISEWIDGNYGFVLDVAIKTVSRELSKAEAQAESEERIQQAELIEIEGLTVMVQDFYLTSSRKFASVGHIVSAEYADANKVSLILDSARDPEQYSLLRTQLGEDSGLNLKELQGSEGVAFAHPSGFFAAVKRDSDWKALVKQLA